MRFIKESPREQPKISLILLDWSVRESFQILHYLGRQNVDRNQFEVLVIEYFSRESEAVKPYRDLVDTWVLLEMPESCMYHKHLMYNCGIALSHGEIVITCDSDSMVKEGFIRTITKEFESHERIVLHMDQFRNTRKEFYPFNYPSFDEVLGEGCVNNRGGRTEGIGDREDPLHSRNYGACMGAKRADLIAIGGADEHTDYLGHICGPYEMTFRLINSGLQEFWDETEFLYHTWHPGQDGVDNYKGPDDGKQMSSTALDAMITNRVMPLVPNKGIQLLRCKGKVSDEVIQANLVDRQYPLEWNRSKLTQRRARWGGTSEKGRTDLFRGYRITKESDVYYAWPLIDAHVHGGDRAQFDLVLQSTSLDGIHGEINRNYPKVLRMSEMVNAAYYGLFMTVVWTVGAPLKALARLFTSWKSGKGKGYSRGQPVLATMREFIRKYKSNWSAAKRSWAYMNRWTDILVANIYYLRHLTRSDRRWSRPVLLTRSRYIQFYLASLMRVKLLPMLQIISLRDAVQIHSCFQTLDGKSEPIGIIVAHDLFTKHYGMFNSVFRSRDALII